MGGPGVAAPGRRSRWTLPLVAAGAVVLLIAASIGGVEIWRNTGASSNATNGHGSSSANGTGNNGTGDNGAGTDIAGGGQTANPSGRQQNLDVNKTAWYGGLKIAFGKVTYDADKDPQLSVETVMENLGPRDVRPDIDIVFSTGGQTYEGQARESTTVAAGQKSNVHLDFAVRQQLGGPLAQGVFTIGRGDEAQAVVPVGPTGLVAYEPKVILKNKKIAARDLVVTYTTCELRGGFTDWHGQAKTGNRALTCSVDVQYTGGSGGGKYVGEETFRLGLPDGTEVGPTVAPNEALYSANVVPNTYLGFMIKWPAPGTYLLRVINIPLGERRSPSSVFEVPITL